MVNLSAISTVTTAAGALSSLIMVNPQSVVGYQPKQTKNKDGTWPPYAPAFLFHYEGENTVQIESDITDHYVEDNSALQDQISVKPEIVSVHGYIGELNDVLPSVLAPLKTIADKLSIISSYLPALSATAILALNEAEFAYNTVNNAIGSGVAAWNSVNGMISGNGLTAQTVIGSGPIHTGTNQNKQQLAFQQFYGYWRNRTLFMIQTPWAVFDNMAIRSLRAVQDETTNTVTDFEISFKMIRFASSQMLGLAAGQGRYNQTSVNQGTNALTTSVPYSTQLVSSYPGVQ